MAENFLDGTGSKPISWWMFEEASSPAVDGNTTNANDLTWAGGSTARDTSVFVQGAASLATPFTTSHATRAFASLSANFPFKAATADFTAGGWFYTKGNFSAFSTMLYHSDVSSKGWVLWSGATGKFRLDLYSAGGTATINQAGAAYTTDGWHHVLVRWNGSNVSGAGANDEVSLWIDGVKEATTHTRTSVALCTAEAMTLDGSSAGAIRFDECFVFDVPLLDTQIADIYAHGLDGTRAVAAGPQFRIAAMVG